MKTYTEFKAAIRARESSGSYSTKNSLGYLGAYQFGLARLCDFGFTSRIDPSSHGFANSAFKWNAPLSEVIFLGSQAFQDMLFDTHVSRLKASCIRLDCYQNPSGSIAVCHLLGLGDLEPFLKKGIDSVDGFGTKASDYFQLFTGYEIP